MGSEVNVVMHGGCLGSVCAAYSDLLLNAASLISLSSVVNQHGFTELPINDTKRMTDLQYAKDQNDQWLLTRRSHLLLVHIGRSILHCNVYFPCVHVQSATHCCLLTEWT